MSEERPIPKPELPVPFAVKLAKMLAYGDKPSDCPRWLTDFFLEWEKISRGVNGKRQPDHAELNIPVCFAVMMHDRDETIKSLCERVKALEARRVEDETVKGEPVADAEAPPDLRTKEGRAWKARQEAAAGV